MVDDTIRMSRSLKRRRDAIAGFQGLRWAALAAAGCGLALGTVRIAAQAAGAGMLQQGIEVIRETLAKDGLYTRTTNSERNNYSSKTERKFSLTEANGCSLVVTSDAHIHTEMPTQNRVTDRRWNDIYHPDFSVMDPATVTVAPPEAPQAQWQTQGYLVRISIEVGKPLMAASSVDVATNSAQDLPGLPNLAVYVTTKEAADRLAKAFAQVAQACRANAAAK